jgi:hypothetical protein
MEAICNGIGAIAAIGAAGFWFYSARIKIPDFLDMPFGGKGSLDDLMREQSKYSAIAAIFAAISAISPIFANYFHISK